MTVAYWVAAVVRFAMELATLAALGAWGSGVGASTPMRVTLAVAVPLAAAVVWGLFCSPRARIPLPLVPTLVVQAAVFGAGALALAALGLPGLALALVVLAVGSALVLHVLEPRIDRSVVRNG